MTGQGVAVFGDQARRYRMSAATMPWIDEHALVGRIA
jgi:hypothetical protein